MYGIDNTFLSYGLSKEEYITLRRRYNTSIRTNFPQIKHLNTDEFTDLLAVPAFMVIIRFDSLSDEQLEDFNECYKGFGATILVATGATKHEERYMLLIETDNKQLKNLKSIITDKDPKAFISISDTKSTYNGYFRNRV